MEKVEKPFNVEAKINDRTYTVTVCYDSSYPYTHALFLRYTYEYALTAIEEVFPSSKWRKYEPQLPDIV